MTVVIVHITTSRRYSKTRDTSICCQISSPLALLDLLLSQHVIIFLFGKTHKTCFMTSTALAHRGVWKLLFKYP